MLARHAAAAAPLRVCARHPPPPACRRRHGLALASSAHVVPRGATVRTAAAPPAVPESAPERGDVAPIERPTFNVAGTMTTAAPPSTAWAALTDYPAAPSIFRSVAACRALSDADAAAALAAAAPAAVSADAAAVADAADGATPPVVIEQAVGWSFLVFGGAFRMTLAVRRAAPPPGAPPGTRALAFDLVQSRYLASFRGVWTVAPGPDGGCAVTHELAVTPRAAPPAAIHGLVSSLFRKQVNTLLDDLAAELGRRCSELESE